MFSVIKEGEILEKDIEKWLGARVKALGCLYYKFVSPGNRGVPDRIIIMPPGLAVFVELKTDKGRISAVQEIQIGRLRSIGAPVRIIKGIKDAEQLVCDIRFAIAASTKQGAVEEWL